MSVSADNRRIAKNTLALYARTAVTLLIALFTSRVVLQTLGVVDFGIYNVVGGVVVLFSFLNAAMSSATQRFLNFELGRKNLAQVARVFSMSMSVHFCIAGTVLILAETLGLWFLNTQLNIPAERMVAANWVYQFSVASTLLGIMLVSYNATIIAHERMTFFAAVSVVTAFLKLGIVYLLWIGDADKLILYAALTLAVGVLMQIVHVVYCRRAFPRVAVYKPFRDGKLFKELVSFSAWSLFGGIANMSASQGVNMIVNIFCGVAVNAASGIAGQVCASVSQFVSNFQTAFNPQIVKHYSAGEHDLFLRLIFRTSKISFFLLFFFAFPLGLNAEFVLKIWLGDVPAFSADFVRWTLVFALVDALSGPLWMSIQATGKIRAYQLIVSAFIFSNLPISALLLWLGYSPVAVFASRAIINFLTAIWRVFYLRKRIGLPARKFLRKVFGRVVFVSGISAIVPAMVFACVPANLPWTRLVSSCSASALCVGVVIWWLGFDKDEREKIASLFFSKILKTS